MSRRRCFFTLVVTMLFSSTGSVLGVQRQSATPNPYLFSMDVALSEAEPPVALGIRDGQTVAQAAAAFCQEQELDEELTRTLLPQIVQILEEGIAEAMGDQRDALPTNEFDSPHVDDHDDHHIVEGRPNDGELMNFSTADGPLLTLDVSLDGDSTSTLEYYGWQDPTYTASLFCNKRIPSSDPDALARCTGSLSSTITARRDAVIASRSLEVNSDRLAQQQQQQQQQQQTQQRLQQGGRRQRVDDKQDPWLTVPLNVNGLETNLPIFEGTSPRDTAISFCRWEEFSLEGEAFDSCVAQVTEVTLHAISVHKNRQPAAFRHQQQQQGPEPFTFSIPVSLAGLTLFADFRSDQKPRASAERFCQLHLPKIETALGPELFLAMDEEMEEDSEEREVEQRRKARRDLQDACAQVVESAINAVLLGLRDLVMEAELAQIDAIKRHETQVGQDDNIDGRLNRSERSHVPSPDSALDPAYRATESGVV